MIKKTRKNTRRYGKGNSSITEKLLITPLSEWSKNDIKDALVSKDYSFLTTFKITKLSKNDNWLNIMVSDPLIRKGKSTIVPRKTGSWGKLTDKNKASKRFNDRVWVANTITFILNYFDSENKEKTWWDLSIEEKNNIEMLRFQELISQNSNNLENVGISMQFSNKNHMGKGSYKKHKSKKSTKYKQKKNR